MYHIFFIECLPSFLELRIKWGKKNNEIITSFEYHSSAQKKKENKNNKNATVNNIFNTQGKSHDGLKLCRKINTQYFILVSSSCSKLHYRASLNINIPCTCQSRTFIFFYQLRLQFECFQRRSSDCIFKKPILMITSLNIIQSKY